jgi:hypothetical protein
LINEGKIGVEAERGGDDVTKVVLKRSGFAALRRSAGVTAIIQAKAAEIASRAGDGFETRPMEMGATVRGRPRIAVVTSSFEAMLEEAKHRTLTRAAGSAGGSPTWTRRR